MIKSSVTTTCVAYRAYDYLLSQIIINVNVIIKVLYAKIQKEKTEKKILMSSRI